MFQRRMFKKFTEKENVSGITQLKSSVQKGIRDPVPYNLFSWRFLFAYGIHVASKVCIFSRSSLLTIKIVFSLLMLGMIAQGGNVGES